MPPRHEHGRVGDLSRYAIASGGYGSAMLLLTSSGGLVLGGMYALIAMGLTLQYGVARIMNLSYGEFLVARGVRRLLAVHGLR